MRISGWSSDVCSSDLLAARPPWRHIGASMPNVPSLTLALWATNLATPLNGLAGWTAHVDSKMAEAAAAGAKLLVMPEYACESWLAFKPEGLAPDEEIAWVARQAPSALGRDRRSGAEGKRGYG